MEKLCYGCFQKLEAEGICPYCGFDPQRAADKYPLALPLGSILNGRYLVGKVLGQGGFGITYLALDNQTNEKLVIKEFMPDTVAIRRGTHTVSVLTEERNDNFAYGKACFLNEAQMLAQFTAEENIVHVYSYFEENGTAYFSMEYVEGEDLKHYMAARGGRLPWKEAVTILLPIMEALDKVHGRGVIHRDVAPDNIYVTKDGRSKLLDFGAARYSMGDRSCSLDAVLKHGFAPKEQYSRHGRQGPYTDVYAMGATLYYAITGKKPQDAIERMDEDNLALPSALAEVPEKAEAPMLKALCVQPEGRYATMGAFYQALQAAMQDEAPVALPSPVTNVIPSDSVITPAPVVPSAPVVPPAPAAPMKKRNIALFSAAGGVLFAAILCLIFIPMGVRCARYNRAAEYTEQGRYNEAIALYEELEDYKDSETQLLGARYGKAAEQMKAEEYEAAREAFLALGDYEDSADKAEYCRDGIRYQAGISALESSAWDDAISIFRELTDFEDGADRLCQAYYGKAAEQEAASRWQEAAENYTLADGYSDSNERVRYCTYKCGCESLANEDYADAIKIFTALGSYEDSKAKVKECYYNWGIALAYSENWSDALQAFENAGTYSDSATQIQRCKYELACGLLEAESYLEAVEAFDALGDYKDSAEKKLEAEYAYVLAFWDADDETCQQYMQDLTEHDYEDVAELEVYLQARALEEAEDWFNAWVAYSDIDYADSGERCLRCMYNYAMECWEKDEYETAVLYFDYLHEFAKQDYEDAYINAAQARWDYVQKHRNNTDKTTYEYMCYLMDEGFDEVADTYHELYDWKVEIIYANNVEGDKQSLLYSADAADVARYFQFGIRLTGGTPDEQVDVSVDIYCPNGTTLYKDWSDLACGAEKGAYWKDLDISRFIGTDNHVYFYVEYYSEASEEWVELDTFTLTLY